MTLGQFLGIVEMRTKVISMSTLAGATLYALRETKRLDPIVLALTLTSVILVDMGTTAFNSFFDYWRGDDRDMRLREPDKVLATEGVPALAAFIVAVACYFAAACLGIVLAFRSGAWVISAGILCLAVGFLYNAGPRPISRTPLGEFVSGAFLGTALFLIAFRVQAGGWGTGALLRIRPGRPHDRVHPFGQQRLRHRRRPRRGPEDSRHPPRPSGGRPPSAHARSGRLRRHDRLGDLRIAADGRGGHGFGGGHRILAYIRPDAERRVLP